MPEKGFYYLHTNGDLIYKKFRPEADSDFVAHIWEFDASSRFDAWRIAIEAFALGARRERIMELKEHWQLTDEDAAIFVKESGGLMKLEFLPDENKWRATFGDFVDEQQSQHGKGDTAQEPDHHHQDQAGLPADAGFLPRSGLDRKAPAHQGRGREGQGQVRA